MACRLDILKLRYYWKIMYASTGLLHNIIAYKKDKLLENNFGFAREVFNLCCKINNLSFWHGIHKRNSNPLNEIKRAVTKHYYERDMQIARNKNCLFSTLLFTDTQETKNKPYMLINLLRNSGTFSDTLTRTKYIKALLNSNSYLQECKLCELKYYNLLYHHLTACPKLANQRNILRNKFILYGSSNPNLANPATLISQTLTNKNLLRAFTHFLTTSAY